MEKLAFIESAINGSTQECVIWPFNKDKDGYGWMSRFGEKRAHRVAYTLAYGEIQRGLTVMHSCDNPSCVNPRHLSTGTHADNMADMAKKGRAAIPPGGVSHIDNRGERHGKAKITAKSVREIRRAASSGALPQREIAATYGLSRQSVSDIIRRVTWSHI